MQNPLTQFGCARPVPCQFCNLWDQFEWKSFDLLVRCRINFLSHSFLSSEGIKIGALWHCDIIACLFYADVCILLNCPSQVRLETPLNLPLLHALPPCFFGLVSSSFTLVKRHQISAALWSSAEMPLKQQRSRFFFWEALFWCALSLSFFNFFCCPTSCMLYFQAENGFEWLWCDRTDSSGRAFFAAFMRCLFAS